MFARLRWGVPADDQNPLSFSLSSDIDGDVGEAVEQVSNDIVTSSMLPLLDFRSVLTCQALVTCRRSTNYDLNCQTGPTDYVT
jgi:hypothetical protein